jgi:hypothetical protein
MKRRGVTMSPAIHKKRGVHFFLGVFEDPMFEEYKVVVAVADSL